MHRLTGGLIIESSIFDCATLAEEETEDPITVQQFLESNTANTFTSPMLGDPFDVASPDFKPQPGSPARSGAVIPSDPFFEQVTFRGGIDPDDDWTVGWTTNVEN